MGKRELLIAFAFLVVGIVAWQFTAPPASGNRGFSLRDLWNRAREEMRADSERARITRTETIALDRAVREVRLTELPRGLKIVGEAREDLAYELSVESTGPTVAAATESAERVALLTDTLGETLSLRIEYPGAGRQRALLVLRVPHRVAIRAQGIRGVEASDLASLHFDGVSGDVTARAIRGAVTGTHSAGELVVSGAASVKLTLLPGSRARIDQVTDGVTIDARTGQLTIDGTAGPLEITGLNEQIRIARHTGEVRIGGSGGRVELDGPTADSRVDMRRAEIEVTLRAAVPLALLTTDEVITLTIAGTPAIVLDAAATDARIDATALALQPDVSGADARLAHVFVPGAAARVSLRNLRGDIVIAKVK
jgi:hypothetical protein